ncbi:uncharacterized protein LOC118751261 [Rhagoletis pomonella]|uniref:uncharacterized protein LOC118751261 n=1 Tax=Rhagoletis pomonella TaxID=28610 RepID=UPI0017832021|nr:uncharacterized protein LOC118751261 [Rhagoletis pomonella]
MKHNKLRRHRVKECVNLVELIRRKRNQACSFSCSSSYRRNIRSRGNIVSDNKRSLGLKYSQNQNYAFQQNLEASAVFERSSPSLISSDRASQKNIVRNYCREHDTKINAPLNQNLSKPESQDIMLPGRTINHDCDEEPRLRDDNEKPFVPSDEVLSAKTDISTPQQTLNSYAVFDLQQSNENEEFHLINDGLITENTSIHSQSKLQNIDNTFIAEHVSSRQIITDEEAGGDGHHNNSIIEIEITLHSSNDTNSEEEVEVD